MLGNIFKLAKLTIRAHRDAKRTQKVSLGLLRDSLEVQYNPESLTTRHASVFQGRQGIAVHGGQARWAYNPGTELTVKLIFDGTRVGSMGVLGFRDPSVAKQVEDFLTLCYDVQSESHEPAYLTLTWGHGVLGSGGFKCRLESVDIQYTLFNRDGSPLRAELSAKFVEALDPDAAKRELRLSSPDLSHRRIVRAGDTLPLLCREIYGSPEHYLRVAEVNSLDDFRELVPGQALIFPPFDRGER
ncbi:MAG TPA: hypothetical protein VK034_01345 [Enhygromyxa sp.]|nr:hypothetical protein [Enhygromyxa sp.]